MSKVEEEIYIDKLLNSILFIKDLNLNEEGLVTLLADTSKSNKTAVRSILNAINYLRMDFFSKE